MLLQQWVEFSRNLISRRRRRSREDAVDAELVRERLRKAQADPDEVVTGAELEARLREIVG